MRASTFMPDLLSSLSRLRRTAPAGIDIEVLDQIEERVVDLERLASHEERSVDALRRQIGVAIAEAPVETQRALVRDACADADARVSARPDELLRRARELRPDSPATKLCRYEDILDLWDAERRVVPGDVSVADR